MRRRKRLYRSIRSAKLWVVFAGGLLWLAGCSGQQSVALQRLFRGEESHRVKIVMRSAGRGSSQTSPAPPCLSRSIF